VDNEAESAVNSSVLGNTVGRKNLRERLLQAGFMRCANFDARRAVCTAPECRFDFQTNSCATHN